MQDVRNTIVAFLSYIFGTSVPIGIPPLVWILVKIAVAVFVAVYAVSLFIDQVGKIVETWTQKLQPQFYDEHEKRRSRRRRQFACHLENELMNMDNQQDWNDYRFAELEAEVEANGLTMFTGIVPFIRRKRPSFRHEKSLSKALQSSADTVIFLEGEPGSGKSVALRYVARRMGERARNSKNANSIIPIYVNLSLLERKKGEEIDRNLIESFVLSELKRNNNRDIERFLDDEFSLGMQDGTFFFFFDSFDEIPEVLSSTEVDHIIRAYTKAIDDFLCGMNTCKGIVASRKFHSPKRKNWAHFRILPLSEERQKNLIRKTNLGLGQQMKLIQQLGNANHEIFSVASNPFYLTLICEYLEAGYSFPENMHAVFEKYIEERITHDENSLMLYHQLNAGQVRKMAENIAFCMTADALLGLSPTSANLKDAMLRQGMEVDDHFEAYLKALEYLKLARSDKARTTQLQSFTFAHRRFQEYFATCVVLREPWRVDTRELLTNARWRETAVVLCQSQPGGALSPIINEAQSLLINSIRAIPDDLRTKFGSNRGLLSDPEEYAVSGITGIVRSKVSTPIEFPWPVGALHVLGLLQDGFSARILELPRDVRIQISQLILSATSAGRQLDREAGLRVAGLVPQDILEFLVVEAFSDGSQRLKEIAFRQTARMRRLTPQMMQGIRDMIVELMKRDRLRREKIAIEAHLSLLPLATQFLSMLHFFLWIDTLDVLLYVGLCLVVLSAFVSSKLSAPTITAFLLAATLSHVLFRIFKKQCAPAIQSFSPTSQSVLSGLGIFMLLGIALFLRFLFFFYFVEQWRDESIRNLYPFQFPQNIVIAFLAFYVAFYAPISVWIVSEGIIAKRRNWLFIPIIAIAYLLKRTRSEVMLLLPKREQQSKRALTLIFVRIFLLVIVVIALLSAIISFVLWLNFILHPYTQFIDIAVFIALEALLVLDIVPATQDMLRRYTWFQNHSASLTCQEFLNELAIYRTTYACVVFIREIKDRRLLAATRENKEQLADFACDVEVMHRKKKEAAESMRKTAQVQQVQKPGKLNNLSSDKYSSLVSKVTPEILDEIYNLIEEIQETIIERRK